MTQQVNVTMERDPCSDVTKKGTVDHGCSLPPDENNIGLKAFRLPRESEGDAPGSESAPSRSVSGGRNHLKLNPERETGCAAERSERQPLVHDNSQTEMTDRGDRSRSILFRDQCSDQASGNQLQSSSASAQTIKDGKKLHQCTVCDKTLRR